MKVVNVVSSDSSTFSGTAQESSDNENHDHIKLGALPPDPWLISEIDRVINKKVSVKTNSKD